MWQNSELSHFGVAWKALAFVEFDYKGLRDYLGPGQNYYISSFSSGSKLLKISCNIDVLDCVCAKRAAKLKTVLSGV